MKEQKIKVIASTTFICKAGEILTLTDNGLIDSDGCNWTDFLDKEGDTLFEKWINWFSVCGDTEKFELIEECLTPFNKLMKEKFDIDIGDTFDIEGSDSNPYTLRANSFYNIYGENGSYRLINIIFGETKVTKHESKPLEITLAEIAEKLGVDAVKIVDRKDEK